MAVVVNVQNIINVAKISQYLSRADINRNIFKGDGDVNVGYDRLLYMVRLAVEWAYAQDPNDETLNATATYLWRLCGRYMSAAQTIANDEACSVPVILTQPLSQSAEEGDNVTLFVVAYSLAAMTYQWYKDGVEMSGETDTTLELTNMASGDFADYTVVVTTSCGAVTSNAAVLTNDTPVEEPLIYFSTNETGVAPTEAQILGGNENTDDPLGDVYLYWGNTPVTPVWYWLAIPQVGANALKNRWYESTLNQGSMGTVTDLFGAPTTVSVDGQDYYVWITNYATQFVNNDYIFSKV